MTTYGNETPQLDNDVQNYLERVMKVLEREGFNNIKDFLLDKEDELNELLYMEYEND